MALRNDLGLLSEEYDPLAKRLVGNFPQAFSHVSLINSAFRLSGNDPLAPADERTRPLLLDKSSVTNPMQRMKSLGRVASARRRAGAAALRARPMPAGSRS